MTASSGSLPHHQHFTACFSVTAAADPGAMPRVLEVFAKRGLVPSQWHSTVAGRAGDELHIDIQVACADQALATRLAEGLRQVVCVRAVLTAEKRQLLSA
jgi:acetolactate synthase regulatory subunit